MHHPSVDSGHVSVGVEHQASNSLLAEDELLGSLSDAALDGSHERQPTIATGLTILDATDAN